jgi:hypothetical protein
MKKKSVIEAIEEGHRFIERLTEPGKMSKADALETLETIIERLYV